MSKFTIPVASYTTVHVYVCVCTCHVPCYRLHTQNTCVTKRCALKLKQMVMPIFYSACGAAGHVKQLPKQVLIVSCLINIQIDTTAFITQCVNDLQPITKAERPIHFAVFHKFSIPQKLAQA